MPIRPENRWLYPIDWKELSAVIRFERAKGRCEGCGRPHGKLVYHLGDGRWWDEAARTWRNGRGRVLKLACPTELPAGLTLHTTQVVLACAHLDHDPGNNHPRNLRAYCQRCHLIHDRAEHLRQRWFTYRLRWALGDLFLGAYPVRSERRSSVAHRISLVLPGELVGKVMHDPGLSPATKSRKGGQQQPCRL